MVKTIRISDDVHSAMAEVSGIMQAQLKKRVTLQDAVRILAEEYLDKRKKQVFR